LQKSIDQFKTVRGYDTKNVIKKVAQDGNLKPPCNDIIPIAHQGEA